MKRSYPFASSGILTEVLSDEREIHRAAVTKLLDGLAGKVKFKLKVQRASILLITDAAFSVIGFRKNGNRLFVEFYSDEVIFSPKAEETGQRDGRRIYRVSLNGMDEVNEELIKWILHSHHLTHPTKP